MQEVVLTGCSSRRYRSRAPSKRGHNRISFRNSVRLITLGGLSLVGSDGAAIGVPRRKPLALLAILATHEGDGVPRDRVSALLWPDGEDERARHALTQALYSLRRATGVADLVLGTTTLRLNDERVRADVRVLQAALQGGDLAAAAAAYGGPFLDGVVYKGCVEFDQWVETVRLRHARALRDARLALAQAADDPDAAVAHLRAAFAADPHDATLTLTLARALVDARDRAAALRVVQTHERSLELDFGARLDADLQRFVQTLRAGPEAPSGPPPLGPAAIPSTPSATGAPLMAVLSGPIEPIAPIPPRRVTRRLRAAAMVAVGAVLAGAWWAQRSVTAAAGPDAVSVPRWRASLPDSAAPLLVLPFADERVRGAAPDDPPAGAGAADLVAAALSGTSLVRPVPSEAPGPPGTRVPVRPDSAAVLARRAHVPFFLLGAVTRVGGELHLAVSLRDTVDPQRVQVAAQAVVAGPQAIVAGIDSLATSVLLARAVATTAGAFADAAAAATTSLPAFKAFLDGERAFRRGRYGDAMVAYQRAITLDPRFALAHYRLGEAAEWAGDGDALERGLRRANALANRLPLRERMLAEAAVAWRWGSVLHAEQVLRRAGELYPSDPEVAYALGEVVLHSGYVVGQPIATAGPMFGRALAGESDNVEALAHLARVLVRGGRIDSADALYRRMHHLRGPTDRLTGEVGLMIALARGDRPRLLHVADSLAALGQDEPLLSLVAWRGAAFTDSVQLAHTFARRLAESTSNPWTRTQTRWYMAEYAAVAGRLPEALRLAGVERGDRRDNLGMRAYLVALTFHAVPRATLEAYVDSLRAWRVTVPDGAHGHEAAAGADARLRDYPRGLLAMRLGDTTAAHAAAEALAHVERREIADVARGLAGALRAELAWARGDAPGALAMLDTAMDVVPLPWRLTLFGGFARERWRRAEWLRALGRHAEALRWYGTLGQDCAGELLFAYSGAQGAAASHAALGHALDAAREQARAARLRASARDVLP